MADGEAATPKRPRPLTPPEVTAAIQYCLTAGQVVPTKHFREQGFLRHYTVQDAVNALEVGQVSSDPPQWNERMRDWTYKVHGLDLEDDVLTVVVGIGPRKHVVWLVTAY